jgi:hypothetical protein
VADLTTDPALRLTTHGERQLTPAPRDGLDAPFAMPPVGLQPGAIASCPPLRVIYVVVQREPTPGGPGSGLRPGRKCFSCQPAAAPVLYIYVLDICALGICAHRPQVLPMPAAALINSIATYIYILSLHRLGH